MEYNHTIKEIAEKVGKTPQSIQKLRGKNLSFFEVHTKSRGRTLYFDETAFEWIMDYYRVPPSAAQKQPNTTEEQPAATDAGATSPDTKAKTTSTPPDDTGKTTDAAQEQPKPTQNEALLLLKVKELEGQLEQTKKALEKAQKEADENRQLYRALVVALANEQANLRTALEARKPFLARLKALFTREKPALLAPVEAQPAEADE